MSELRNRAEIPVEDTWATEDMYVSIAEKDFQKIIPLPLGIIVLHYV